MDPLDNEDLRDQRPSKTRRKQDMHALQDLGARLVELSPERLARVPLPESLHDAVVEAQRIRGHEARRRQLQYIGRLMRDVDAAPIQEALDAIAGVSAAQNALHHRLERLREQLMENESALSEIAAEHPDADLQRLRQLRRNALKERETSKPPRSYREIFRVLRQVYESPEAADE